MTNTTVLEQRKDLQHRALRIVKGMNTGQNLEDLKHLLNELLLLGLLDPVNLFDTPQDRDTVYASIRGLIQDLTEMQSWYEDFQNYKEFKAAPPGLTSEQPPADAPHE